MVLSEKFGRSDIEGRFSLGSDGNGCEGLGSTGCGREGHERLETLSDERERLLT